MNESNFKPYAKKRFGQNFLVDSNALDRIVDCLKLAKDDCVLEIGPGRGALTERLLTQLSHLYAIELDRDLIEPLQHRFDPDQLTLFEIDVLKFDFNEFLAQNPTIKLVGNLPYNISTQVMFKLIPFANHFMNLHFMLQKEVVDRLGAIPNTKAYGRLSVLMQYYFEVQPLFTLGPNSFKPAPKVDSSFVRLTPRHSIQHVVVNANNFKAVVANAFQQRRKTLRNALKNLISAEQLKSLGIEPTLRAENLTVDQFVIISNHLQLN